MINIYNLFWIVPLASSVGVLIALFLAGAAKTGREYDEMLAEENIRAKSDEIERLEAENSTIREALEKSVNNVFSLETMITIKNTRIKGLELRLKELAELDEKIRAGREYVSKKFAEVIE